MTFLPDFATDVLKLLFEERKQRFGVAENDDFLIMNGNRALPLEIRRKTPISSLAHIVKEAARNAGIKDYDKVTPKSLRKAFEAILEMPTLDGPTLHERQTKYFMAHKIGGSEDRYIDKRNERRWRAVFKRINFKLSARQDTDPSIQKLERRVSELQECVSKIEKSISDKNTVVSQEKGSNSTNIEPLEINRDKKCDQEKPPYYNLVSNGIQRENEYMVSIKPVQVRTFSRLVMTKQGLRKIPVRSFIRKVAVIKLTEQSKPQRASDLMTTEMEPCHPI